MHENTTTVYRLDDPDSRHAEVALRRAAIKAQRQAREAGLEPVVAGRVTSEAEGEPMHTDEATNPAREVFDRDGVLTALRDLKSEWRSRGLLSLGVFGSFARNAETTDSDLDVYVRTETANPYLLVHLKAAIEGRVQRRVDIVRLRDRMNPYLRSRIEREGFDV
jgi:predicted nucleotidyltransferase